MYRSGAWERPAGYVAPKPLPTSLFWVAKAFFELSAKRPWIGGMAGAPMPIPDDRIDYYFSSTLGLRGEDRRASFRKRIDALDHVWISDWCERAKRKAEDEARDGRKSQRSDPA